MKIQTLTIYPAQEVLTKITKEVLNLFKVEIVGGRAPADYAQLSVVYRRLPDDAAGRVRAGVRLYAFRRDGTQELYEEAGGGAADEREMAAFHRILKLGLYHIFRRHFGMPQAPWGILHGVRPTKIVHRWIAGGLDEAAIIERLQRDYACSREKAELIVPMAFRQLPFLRTSSEKTVSIYVGIPFCLTRCLYCSFPANILPGEAQLRVFMEVFRKDLAAAQAAVRRYGFTVQNIYVGGGTPTSLPDNFFAEMLHLVYNAFYGPACGEFTVEAGRPDSMSAAKIETMRALGVTRVSVNPQSMQEETLVRIGRRHTPSQVVEMFRALRAAGIPHINMDLILGLPGETAADVEDTMRQVVALAPDDITLHALALKRGSRLKLMMEEQHVELPDDAETRRMSETALRYVRAVGMRPYYLYRQGYMSGDLENIGCCRPGAEGMYNIQIMEEHQTILGIGGAATTKVVDFRRHRMKSAFNAKDLTTYLRDIDHYIEKRALLLEEAYGE